MIDFYISVFGKDRKYAIFNFENPQIRRNEDVSFQFSSLSLAKPLS